VNVILTSIGFFKNYNK